VPATVVADAEATRRFPDAAEVPDTWQSGDLLLEQYEVRGILGAGGMGTVYRVHHRGWDLDLAVKSPHPAMLAQAGGSAAFTAEAEAWVALGLHPHIVTCHYVRALGGSPGSSRGQAALGRRPRVGLRAAVINPTRRRWPS